MSEDTRSLAEWSMVPIVEPLGASAIDQIPDQEKRDKLKQSLTDFRAVLLDFYTIDTTDLSDDEMLAGYAAFDAMARSFPTDVTTFIQAYRGLIVSSGLRTFIAACQNSLAKKEKEQEGSPPV